MATTFTAYTYSNEHGENGAIAYKCATIDEVREDLTTAASGKPIIEQDDVDYIIIVDEFDEDNEWILTTSGELILTD